MAQPLKLFCIFENKGQTSLPLCTRRYISRINMFSANENLMLRQHKRQIVGWVEETISEEALDFGTTVMVMQVSCKAPGCVPLETAIIIVFPHSSDELVLGLPESQNAGNYKTKILKPMSEVTQEDVLEALPPAFEGGTRTLEKLCIGARDIMLAQITQLFGEEDDSTVQDRKGMAEFLQLCLQQYIDNNCKPPELGEPLKLPQDEEEGKDRTEKKLESKYITCKQAGLSPQNKKYAGKGNIVISRVLEEPALFLSLPSASPSIANTTSTATNTYSTSRPISHLNAIDKALNPLKSSKNISKLFEKEHAPGIRQAGCPCCDPDNPSNFVDQMMMI
jgi:hypothetical protein